MGSVPSSRPSSFATVFKDRKKSFEGFRRRAVHAGSWYSENEDELDDTLASFLSDAEETLQSHQNKSYTVDSESLKGGIPTSNHTIYKPQGIPKAIVAPHAGYSYSGETAAYAYSALREAILGGSIERIIVLHPSHHVRLNGCAVSGAKHLLTPLGELTVDVNLRNSLLQSGDGNHFTVMEQRDEEREHSGEMQYPFIYKALSYGTTKPENIPVLPIMVGSLSPSKVESYGQILAPIVAQTNVFTIVSSDFCHWGSRFHYAPFDKNKSSKIFEFIQMLDNIGMEHIQMQNPGAFQLYLQKTRNTICGQYPIQVWLSAVKENRDKNVQALDIQFIRYAQSSQVRKEYESSVSYASGVARLSSVSNSTV